MIRSSNEKISETHVIVLFAAGRHGGRVRIVDALVASTDSEGVYS